VSIYRILYNGAWREVTNLRRGNHVVHYPEQATAAVIKLGPDEWDAIPVTPGDVMTEWEPEVPPESSWTTVD
jgi:hypothetical protein